jgi:hypothetical protein
MCKLIIGARQPFGGETRRFKKRCIVANGGVFQKTDGEGFRDIHAFNL